MKIYAAMTMDNLAFFEHEKKYVQMLEERGHEVYFPWRDEGVIFEDESTLQDRNKTFNNDVQHIKDCDLMICYIDGDDPGTAVEAGIAFALGKPVILYATEFSKLRKGVDIRNVYPIEVLPANSNQPWVTDKLPQINNMLLGVAGNRVFNTPEELVAFVTAVEGL